MINPRKLTLSFLSLAALYLLLKYSGILGLVNFEVASAERANGERLPIIVQVCLPDRVVAFDNVWIDMSDVSLARKSDYINDLYAFVPKSGRNDGATVRNWRFSTDANGTWYAEMFGQDVGVTSAGKGTMFRLIGNTTTNQPVYDYEWDRWVKDIRGIEVNVFYNKPGASADAVDYWFIPPSDIRKDQFTAWQRPISQEIPVTGRHSDTWYKIMNGKKFDVHPVTHAGAPMVRFMVANKSDYLSSHRFPERLQWTITWKNYRDITDEQRGKFRFVPVFDEPIPACEIQK